MKDVQTKREQEKRMVSEMIALYCQKKHGTPKGRLCPECTELTERSALIVRYIVTVRICGKKSAQ